MIYGNVTIIAVGRPKTDVGNKCNVCGKTVYVTEQLLADEKVNKFIVTLMIGHY